MFPKAKIYDATPASVFKDRIIWIQIALATLYFITSCLWTLVIPRHVKFNLDLGESTVGISALFFSVAAIGSRPFINKYGPKYSRHFLMLLGVLLLCAGAISSILFSNIFSVYFIRAMVGIADGLFYVGIATLVIANASKAKQGVAISLYTVSVWTGVALGPAVGEKIYHMNTDEVFRNSGYLTLFLCALMIIWITFLPYRKTDDSHISKKSSAFCKPVILPGLIFMLGLSTWVALETFAPIFANTLGINDVTALFLLLGIGVLIVRLICSPLVDKVNSRILLSISLCSSFIAAIVLSGSNSSAGLYSGTLFIVLSNGLLYPSIIVLSLRRGSDYEQVSILGTQAIFLELSYGLLPVIFGLTAEIYGFDWMFVLALAFIALSFIILWTLKVPAVEIGDNKQAMIEPDVIV